MVMVQCVLLTLICWLAILSVGHLKSWVLISNLNVKSVLPALVCLLPRRLSSENLQARKGGRAWSLALQVVPVSRACLRVFVSVLRGRQLVNINVQNFITTLINKGKLL